MINQFSEQEVESINGFQNAGIFHPFTCGNEKCRAILIATIEGLICPSCDYEQDWVHDFMKDGSWRLMLKKWDQ